MNNMDLFDICFILIMLGFASMLFLVPLMVREEYKNNDKSA